MRKAWKSALLAIVLLIYAFAVASVYGQVEHDETMKLSLRRRVGLGLAGFMQGTFSIGVDAPGDVIRVAFFLDGREISEVGQPPYNLQINTGDYDTGGHSFSAVGYDEQGREYISNTIRRQFIGRESTILIAGIIIVLAIGIRLAAGFMSSRRSQTGSDRDFGVKGGTICPKCGQPFSIHRWSIRIVGLRIDRCPHCLKWNTVRRATAEELSAARSLLVEPQEEDPAEAGSPAGKERWSQKVEESRYDNR